MSEESPVEIHGIGQLEKLKVNWGVVCLYKGGHWFAVSQELMGVDQPLNRLLFFISRTMFNVKMIVVIKFSMWIYVFRYLYLCI